MELESGMQRNPLKSIFFENNYFFGEKKPLRECGLLAQDSFFPKSEFPLFLRKSDLLGKKKSLRECGLLAQDMFFQKI